MSIRIIIADDHTLMREGLRSILENELHLHVVGQADTGRSAVELTRRLKPDVVIMDISMPDLNGVEATRQILSINPSTKVIALSMHADKRYVSAMLSAGASGYLLKHSAVDELYRAICMVSENKTYVSAEVAGVVVQDYIRHLKNGKGADTKPLTAKEREILQLIAEGHTMKDIAGRLNVSVPTIETHKQHIMEKLNLHTIADLTKYAVREGLSSLE